MKNKEQLLSLIGSEKAKLSQGERLDLAELLKEILNLLMVQERELFYLRRIPQEIRLMVIIRELYIFRNFRIGCAKG
jgi:hypothetical protein